MTWAYTSVYPFRDAIGGSYIILYFSLKLVHTNLNYRVVGTSTAAIFLSNNHSLYALIISDECHA